MMTTETGSVMPPQGAANEGTPIQPVVRGAYGSVDGIRQAATNRKAAREAVSAAAAANSPDLNPIDLRRENGPQTVF